MKKLESVKAINNLRAKADIAEELSQRIEDICKYDIFNGDELEPWQIEKNTAYQAKIDVLQSIIEQLIK